MPARSRRLALALPALLALALFTGGRPAVTTAATSFTYDTYFSSAYERQVDSRTCTSASTAMMLNILAGRDRNFDQLSILRYSQPRICPVCSGRSALPRVLSASCSVSTWPRKSALPTVCSQRTRAGRPAS